MRRKIPTGSVFQKTYRNSEGKLCTAATWHVQYYVKGKPARVATGATDREEALRILRERMAKASRYSEYSEQIERVLVDQLLDLVVEDYQFNSRGSTYDTELRINKNLRPFFGKKRAADVTTTVIKKYTAQRAKVAAPATVNKELAFLRRAFELGLQHDPALVERVPHVRMFPLDNARTGIVAHDQYRTIRDFLPSYARIALVIAYHTGSRRGEIRQILLDKIDLQASRIELPGRTTKNKNARYLPIYGDMAAELSMAISLADPKCPFLIQNEGKRVNDWKKSWKSACALAKVDHALFHDLRRTAVTNMIEAGFSEKEAMEISGHNTRSVFDRYHIVSQRRLKQLGQRMEDHIRSKEKELMVPVNGASEKKNVN